MLERDRAALSVLYIGGTGTISASCVRLSVETGMRVAVLNRGNNAKGRELPEGVDESAVAAVDRGLHAARPPGEPAEPNRAAAQQRNAIATLRAGGTVMRAPNT